MARRKEPAITAEERERNRREADERQRARCAEAARQMQTTAQAYLVAQGALVPGEGVRDRLVRLDEYRQSLLQASAPTYRPTPRQIMARPVAGIDVEVEF